MESMKSSYTIVVVALIAACSASRPPDDELATSIANGLAAACPLGSATSDETARNDCAGKLTELAVLRDTMREPFIWGGQAAGTGYRLDKSTNKFNARVWRRLYLSTFMFGTDFTVEQIADYTVLHVPITFRNDMPIGAYPYPFWHSNNKWDSYSYSTTVHFIIQHGEVIGALRGSEQDSTRPKTAHAWDGLWRWEQGSVAQPYVSLYDYLLSRDNPFTARLDETYRALEARMRQNNCQACHAPDNQGQSQQLEFFVYPNQALTGRHDIITQIEKNEMPPKDNTLGLAAGIADSGERDQLLGLAREFEAAGDQALEWEGDNKVQFTYPDPTP
jgi:mono/diheme cytochrome c family protein